MKEFLVTYKDDKGHTARAVLHGKSAEEVEADFRTVFGTFEIVSVKEERWR